MGSRSRQTPVEVMQGCEMDEGPEGNGRWEEQGAVRERGQGKPLLQVTVELRTHGDKVKATWVFEGGRFMQRKQRKGPCACVHVGAHV